MKEIDRRGKELPPPLYIRQKELMAMLPFSAATLWRLVRLNRFVQPTRLSARVTAWNRAAVISWLEAREGAQK